MRIEEEKHINDILPLRFLSSANKEVLKNGIKMEEILEAASVAGLVCSGSGFAFASMVLEVNE